MRRLRFLIAAGAALWIPAAAQLSGGDEPLDPAVGFQFSAKAADGKIVVSYAIAENLYLYRDRFAFAADGATLSPPHFPPGKMHEDEFFGRTEVYYDQVAVTLAAAAAAGPFVLRVTSQGCDEKIGVCYPPQIQTATLAFVGGNADEIGRADDAGRAADVGRADEVGQAERILGGKSVPLIILAFFGFGLLLSFTPCVLPMVPIVAGIIAGRRDCSRARALALASVYALGMASVYTAAGVAAGFSGALLASVLASPSALIALAALFVALALSMFGFYEIKMPSFAGGWGRGGGYAGVFVLGGVSAILAGPCIAAPLAGVLLFIGKTGDAVLGGIALFSLAAGMSVLLIAVGAGAGALLPKAGAWSESLRRLLGAALLAAAVWAIAPLLFAPLVIAAYGAILLGVGVMLRAADPLPPEAKPPARLAKAFGVLCAVWGILMLAGAAGGGRDAFAPLAHFGGGGGGGGGGEAQQDLPFARVTTVDEWNRALAAAGGRTVMLDFYADWCVSCREMERFTFTDSQVKTRLAPVALVRADVTANDEQSRALLKRFQLFGPPAIIFFDSAGTETPPRVIGFEPPGQFLQSLAAAGL